MPPPNTPAPSGQSEIALVKDEGTFKVPVLINGVFALHFTVDSGAADVSIPADVVATLMRTGTLRPDDFLGTQTYRLADGSTVPSKIFRIRSLKVGDKVIENVTGSMANVEGSLLLGQSFLSRFGRVWFDYNRAGSCCWNEGLWRWPRPGSQTGPDQEAAAGLLHVSGRDERDWRHQVCSTSRFASAFRSRIIAATWRFSAE